MIQDFSPHNTRELNLKILHRSKLLRKIAMITEPVVYRGNSRGLRTQGASLICVAVEKTD